MTTNNLLSKIDSKGPLQVLPEQMDATFITTIAVKLAKWRRGELTDTSERVELEEFAQHWGTIVLPALQPALGDALYESQNCVLAVLVVMSELDYLIQQECISRDLKYRTYRWTDLFDQERLACSVPQFADSFFRYNGLEPLAGEGMRSAMRTSIERFLSDCFSQSTSASSHRNQLGGGEKRLSESASSSQ